MPEGDYLWDRSGTPEAGLVEWEKALKRYRHRTPRSPRKVALLAMAACVLLALIVVPWRRDNAFAVVSPVHQALPPGTTFSTAEEKAEIRAGSAGLLLLAPHSRVTVLEASRRKQRIKLERGSLSAEINAKPYAFVVETPGAVAHDMGCAYTIRTNEAGAGELVVTSGWVHIGARTGDALVAEGFRAPLNGVPIALDADSRFEASVQALLSTGGELDVALQLARRKDALTLLNLLWRVPPTMRARLFAHLTAFAPPPAGVTRERAVAGDWALVGEWWQAFGYPKTVKLPLRYYADGRDE